MSMLVRQTDFLEKEPTRAEIDALSAPVVLEFGTPWCGYCQAAQPLIVAAFARYPGILRMRIEDGPGRPLGRSFRIKLWPTLVFLRQGHEIERLVRPQDSDAIQQALGRLTA